MALYVDRIVNQLAVDAPEVLEQNKNGEQISAVILIRLHYSHTVIQM